MNIGYMGRDMLRIMEVVKCIPSGCSPLSGDTAITAKGLGISIQHYYGFDMYLIGAVKATIASGGRNIVNGYSFYKAVKETGKDLQSWTGGSLAGKTKKQMVTVIKEGDPDDVTKGKPMKILPAGAWFKIKGKVLQTLFKHTCHAASTDPTKQYINGVKLEKIDNGIRAIATDGRHLVYADVPCKTPNFTRFDHKGNEIDLIVPLWAMAAIRKALELSGDWEMAVNNRYFGLRTPDGSVLLQAALLDATFPNYHRVIPEYQDKSFLADADELKKALKALEDKKRSLLGKEGKQDPRVFFKIESLTKLSLMAEDILSNQVIAASAVKIYTQADPVECAFNSNHLQNALGLINKGRVNFAWNIPGRAWTIQPENIPAGMSDALVVIMPMPEHG
jgi:DNA polymerase III sliding clamp (beta) subunit (PCNA family)